MTTDYIVSGSKLASWGQRCTCWVGSESVGALTGRGGTLLPGGPRPSGR